MSECDYILTHTIKHWYRCSASVSNVLGTIQIHVECEINLHKHVSQRAQNYVSPWDKHNLGSLKNTSPNSKIKKETVGLSVNINDKIKREVTCVSKRNSLQRKSTQNPDCCIHCKHS